MDLAGGRVWLEGWEDFGAWSSVRGPRPVGRRPCDRGLAALEAAGAGWIDADGDARIRRALRSGRTAAETRARARRRVGRRTSRHAGPRRKQGWIDDDGAVRAHVEWRDA